MNTPAHAAPPRLVEGPDLAAEVQACLRRDGFAVVSAPTRCVDLRADPAAALAALVGERPLHHECVDVAPVAGRASIVESDRDGRLHVDAFPFASPDLVVMSCDEQAAVGGESVLVDTRAVLRDLAAADPRLLADLFLRYREFRFPAYHVHAPTMSLRNGRLMCHHATFPQPGDDVGVRFQAAVDRAPRIEFRLAAGDFYVIDNHRMLHGRSRFHGPRRLQRLQAWMPTALPVLPAIRDAAALARAWHREQSADASPPMLERLGLARLAVDRLARIPGRGLDDALAAFVAALPVPPDTLPRRLLAIAGGEAAAA